MSVKLLGHRSSFAGRRGGGAHRAGSPFVTLLVGRRTSSRGNGREKGKEGGGAQLLRGRRPFRLRDVGVTCSPFAAAREVQGLRARCEAQSEASGGADAGESGRRCVAKSEETGDRRPAPSADRLTQRVGDVLATDRATRTPFVRACGTRRATSFEASAMDPIAARERERRAGVVSTRARRERGGDPGAQSVHVEPIAFEKARKPRATERSRGALPRRPRHPRGDA